MDIKLAPIAIFCYNRIDTLRQTINSLLNATYASESVVFIFSDGPKVGQNTTIINEIRAYLKLIEGFKKINLIFSETNKGLANSIIGGVSHILETYDSVIVLEDDLICTSNFLIFMNAAIKEYEGSKKVFSISGYSFDLKADNDDECDAYFLNRGWSWGWATWKDRWANIDWQIKDYNDFMSKPQLKREFNKGGSDLTNMLKRQMKNEIDSWGVRWVYNQFKVNGLTLYPNNSKIFNNGFDSRATHTTRASERLGPSMDVTLKQTFIFPTKIEVSENYQKAFQKKMGIVARIKSKISGIFAEIGKK